MNSQLVWGTLSSTKFVRKGKTFSLVWKSCAADSWKLTDMIHYLSHLSLIFISENFQQLFGWLRNIDNLRVNWNECSISACLKNSLRNSSPETCHTADFVLGERNNEKCSTSIKSLNRRNDVLRKSINYNIVWAAGEEKNCIWSEKNCIKVYKISFRFSAAVSKTLLDILGKIIMKTHDKVGRTMDMCLVKINHLFYFIQARSRWISAATHLQQQLPNCLKFFYSFHSLFLLWK